MKKLKQLLTLILAGSIFLTGCGKKDVGSNNTSDTDTVKTDNNSADINLDSSESVSDNKRNTSADTASQEFETPSPTSGVITLKQGYSDSAREVSIMGLKEYKSLKSDKYTDEAKRGKKFLVMFLKVRNRTNEKVYFNVNYLNARVDGKEIENTVLFNDPEGYPTIFSNIAEDSYYGGFIVWEVPKEWKRMEVTYEGWRDSDGLTLSSTFTKKDLSDPEKYSESTYIQKGSE